MAPPVKGLHAWVETHGAAWWFQLSSWHQRLLVPLLTFLRSEQFYPSSSSVSSGRESFARFCSSALRRKSIGSLTDSAGGYGGGLVRRLGLIELILIGIGASIGAGIFVVTGTVARDAGPGVTISFTLAGAACVLNAMCYAELSSRFPAVVGGAYLYTYAAFNELTSFLVFTQLMLDYHICVASIARSLASYFISLLELFPFFKGSIPSWIGHGGKEFFGGVVSVNVLAPIFLVILTVILCFGVKESSTVNSFMTATKVTIVIVVTFAGAFEVDVSNWSPFAPNGFKAISTGATVVFFSYIGFDAVANSAEESKHPQGFANRHFGKPSCMRNTIYWCVLSKTGMVPYMFLVEEAPLAEAFTAKGLKFVAVLISIGAVVGLTTTLLVGLYVQSRLYLGLARDGLLPYIFSNVHPVRHTPIHSQAWVGFVAIMMAGLFNVHQLSHILSVGTLTSYSIVSACVITLRWKDKVSNRLSGRWISALSEGTLCLVIVAFCGFLAGVCFRFGGSSLIMLFAIIIAVLGTLAVQFRQEYAHPPGFSCPGVPIVPIISIFFNMFLCAQLHEEAWYRFFIVNLIAVVIYAIYGQYNANTVSSAHSIVYHGVLSESN